ncbi:hypothetical protein PV08_06442 [Exophiala spinifera]|uniref:Spindle pole body component n=1 Tax=Exophiala spinifera TaxID=91928 RepID=A0A0D1YMW8_9EURO|nr:uncharacterized protein PV08_06442 [Exophiala spinifera]KIW16391.1 hypothetical protein PV08_06442 [Exophiala spinifera]
MAPPILYDPFSSDAITVIPPLAGDAERVWDGFQFNSRLESGLFRLNETKSEIPDLETDILRLQLEDVPLLNLSAPTSQTTSDDEDDGSSEQKADNAEDDVESLWTLPEVTGRRRVIELLSWDTFLDRRHSEPVSGYLSEAGPRAFSSILSASRSAMSAKGLKPDVLLSAFYQLLMGRSSAIFVWDEKQHAFRKQVDHLVAFGYSHQLLQDLFETISRVGAFAKVISETCTFSTGRSSPCRIAFGASVLAALYSVHEYLETTRPEITTMVRLKSIMTKVEVLVTMLNQCAALVQNYKTEESLLTGLMTHLTAMSSCDSRVVAVLQSIFSSSSQPALAKLSAEIGLSSSGPTGDDLFLSQISERHNMWTSILQTEMAEVVLETRESLRLLRLYNPECPVLSTSEYGNSKLSTLEIVYAFNRLCILHSRSSAYEDVRKSSISSTGSSTTTSLLVTPATDSFELSDLDIDRSEPEDPFRFNTNLFEESLDTIKNLNHDDLHSHVLSYLRESEHDENPLRIDIDQALPLSISPLLSAQHRVLSYAVLELIFQQYDLIEHINLQRQFHFMGNPSFSSRLGTALFDPEQSTGETRRRTGVATGLRLQARDTWPPASSELRLVLMSILSDSLSKGQRRNLDDCISFAIRDMPLEELEKCRDVDSIYALDFLRLQYKPPNDVLGTILTTQILDKYDRVFQLLMRLLRLHKLTESMVREGDSITGGDHKLIFEMHHLITTLADYYHNTTIELHWRKFDSVLQDVRAHIVKKDYERTLRAVKSQDYLRALHERTLDSILDGLFLRKRQSKIQQSLEHIFSTILAFAAHRRKEQKPKDGKPADSSEKGFRSRFTEDVKRFVAALLSQDQKQRSASYATETMPSGDADEEVNLLECLLLRLDMFGYWDRGGRAKGISHLDLEFALP